MRRPGTALTCQLLLALLWVPALAAQDRTRELDAFVQQHFEETPVPGFSVVVVEGTRIVFAKGYGVEILGGNQPITADSSIAIGSQTKSLTSVATMQLVEQGLLELDTPVVQYLPWFETADGRAGEITVRMLLNNTSGLPSRDRFLQSVDQSEDAMEEGVRALSNLRLVRQPGESFEYANENWNILGVLISEVTGLSYSGYMQQYVLEPMGMTRSTTALEMFDELDVLYGHFTGIDQGRPANRHFLAEALPAGSELRSTARDMGRYLITMLNDGQYQGRQVLTPESVDLILTAGTEVKLFMPEMGAYGEAVRYTMGWVEVEVEGRTLHQHGGDRITMTSWTILDREAGVGASVLYNGPTLDSYRFHNKTWLAHNLMRIQQGLPLSDFAVPEGPDPNNNDYQLPSELLARYEGSFVSRDGLRAEIYPSPDGDALHLRSRGGAMDYLYEIDFAGEAVAVLRNLSGTSQMRFMMTPDGDVTGFEGGVFGGVFRKRDPKRLATLQEVATVDGSIRSRLPDGWTWSAEPDSIAARNEGSGATLTMGWRDDSWQGRLGELRQGTAESDVDVRSETIGQWVWDQLVIDSAGAGGSQQRLVASTEIGAERAEIVLEAPAGHLTDAVREVLLPLFESLELNR